MMSKILVAAAIAYLLLMALTNNEPGLPHRHEHGEGTHTHGLFPVAAEDIDELVLMSEQAVVHFSKHDSGWLLAERATETSIAGQLDEFAKMLTAAEPVRTFQPEDLVTAGDQDYGFSETGARVKAGDSQGREIIFSFGNATSDGGLRYVRKQGDPALYVMSGFLFDQFEQLIATQPDD